MSSISPTPIPTPALLPGLVGLGVAAFRKKRNSEEPQLTDEIEV
ncbi:PTPA-CTERM sorting domain-containing protein [Alkalinema sp. FACHB-956]|nr:PTPA-CTERM sorting domain-containing protein [Alkalinema sp. FACHB-956]